MLIYIYLSVFLLEYDQKTQGIWRIKDRKNCYMENPLVYYSSFIQKCWKVFIYYLSSIWLFFDVVQHYKHIIYSLDSLEAC